MPAALTDDQKNSTNRAITLQTTIGDTPNALYDIRVATYHNDSADSASLDSDNTYDPPGADKTDPPDAQNHPSTDDEEPQQPPPERADPTDNQILGWISTSIPWSEFRHRLSSNDIGTLSHPMSTAPSQFVNTCWTPPIKSTTPSLLMTAYSHRIWY